MPSLYDRRVFNRLGISPKLIGIFPFTYLFFAILKLVDGVADNDALFDEVGRRYLYRYGNIADVVAIRFVI